MYIILFESIVILFFDHFIRLCRQLRSIIFDNIRHVSAIFMKIILLNIDKIRNFFDHEKIISSFSLYFFHS